MTPPQLDLILGQTLEDYRVSRGERQVLRRILGELRPDERQLATLRQRAFALAREEIGTSPASGALEWLEEVIKVLSEPPDAVQSNGVPSQAWFSPGNDCLRAIVSAMARANLTADICVFTITDDRISDEILACHRRGVSVRIITDNEKAADAGSDIWRLHAADLPIRIDRSFYHMHHKYALFDGKYLLTGSYNWTRTAAAENEENLVLTGDPRLVREFSEHFEKLWEALK
jgi:phosphatidylserine/phosphatidylglycerophosphate/cardiolipin synthase-like enzyme